ncbi:thioredoxin family protein [Portibacter lacus]|uniref:Thioredoxin domain-containing protein n=1 Tax=Portibacter lacus TaxID=1099794 RepID=A0AA37SNC8_9BACT|nr:thioredoxin family protein [Portibacter lacus]GLR17806.1 hypothetical protein GCM10007940_24210 [Portibacter lacus]
MKYLFSFLLLCFFGFGQAQQSISFYENAFDEALLVAEKEGKDIFLDTYAPWCKPCKKMEKVFRNKNVAKFYNQHFINVRVNVDLFKGKELAKKYGIVFLPTMLIMDANGNVKQRIDGVMNPDQMLQIGDMVVNNTMKSVVKSKAKSSNAVPANPVAEPGEKILFVLDDPKASNNPDYLYHEAFFKLEHMDDAHDSIAMKYLNTQEDWSSEKNMNFIVSFLDKTDSELFDYFLAEKDDFQDLMGAENYRKTLEILINDCLYRQIPRPDPEKVASLFSILYPRKYEKYTYEYLLKRYEEEENYNEYVILGEKYLETLIQPNAELLYKLGKYKCLNADKKELKVCLFRVEESIRLSEHPVYDQYLTVAKMYHSLGKDQKALEYAEKARSLSLGDSESLRFVEMFLENLDKS